MIEDLNKTQLVLLTLLVSFVTSIATGVITFSLIQEAPPIVTQTINRVVEQTIQQVVPADTKSGSKEVTTVIVKEEDQVVGSISKITPSIVRITDNSATPEGNPFYSIGTLISKDGLIVASNLSTLNPSLIYSATLADGTTHELAYLGNDKAGFLSFFRIVQKDKATYPVATFSSENAKLGQSLILIEGRDKNIVTVGRVSALSFDTSSGKKVQNGLEMDTEPKTSAFGAPILNLSGEIVGFRTPALTASGTPLFISPIYLKDSIASFQK